MIKEDKEDKMDEIAFTLGICSMMVGQLALIVIPIHAGLHRSVSSMDEVMKYKFKHGEQGVQLCREASEKVNMLSIIQARKE